MRQQREGHWEDPRAAWPLRPQQATLLDPLARLEVEANGGQSGTRRQALRGIFRPLLRPIESSKANQIREAAGGRAGAFLKDGAKARPAPRTSPW